MKEMEVLAKAANFYKEAYKERDKSSVPEYLVDIVIATEIDPDGIHVVIWREASSFPLVYMGNITLADDKELAYVHDVFSSASTWIMYDPEKTLAILHRVGITPTVKKHIVSVQQEYEAFHNIPTPTLHDCAEHYGKILNASSLLERGLATLDVYLNLRCDMINALLHS